MTDDVGVTDVMQRRINNVLYLTKDPNNELNGVPLPALTTLLHGICNNNPERFAALIRVVELFIQRALEET